MPSLDAAGRRASEPSYGPLFSAGLLDPGLAAPALVAGPGGRPAGRRYDVYRNNVTVSLVGALATIYPAIERIMGADFFRMMACDHVRTAPPTSPLLFEYGRDFPAFVESYEPAREMPWLADVARIERLWLDAYHAADAPALAPDALASVPPEVLGDVVFVGHPAARILRSEHPAVAIFVANRSPDPVGPIAQIVPEDALVTRPDMAVDVRRLPAGAAPFLLALLAGRPLGAALETALIEWPALDVSGVIAGMLEAGVFTSLHVGDPS